MFAEYNQSTPPLTHHSPDYNGLFSAGLPTRTLLTEIMLSETLHNIRHVNASIHSLLKRHSGAFGTPPYFKDGRVQQINKTIESELSGEVKIKTNRGKRYYFLKNNVYGMIVFLRIYDLTGGSIIGILPEFTYLDIPISLRTWYNEKTRNGNRKRFHIRQSIIKTLETELNWS